MHGRLPAAIGTRMRSLGAAGLIAVSALAIAAPVSADVEREQRGTCEGGSRWELSLEREHGRIDVDLEIDTAQVGRAWRVKLWHDGSRFLNVRRTTDREGEIDISRLRSDHAGRDTVRFKAVDTVTGNVCRGRLGI